MKSRPQVVPIHTEYITLGQLLKVLDLVGSGAETKLLLEEPGFRVNGEAENRRGKKLRPGDLVTIPNCGPVRIVAEGG